MQGFFLFLGDVLLIVLGEAVKKDQAVTLPVSCYRPVAEAYSVVPGSSPDDGSAEFEVCAPS